MRKPPEGATYKPVNGLIRGLRVLRALSSHSPGRASVVSLAQETGLHRTTVKRLLETLRLAGMVRYVEDSNEYCLAFNVLQLSDGFRQTALISEIARPLMEDLTRRVMWPSDLMIPGGAEMLVCETTHAITPWSFNAGVVGLHVPLLHSAGGRAYLAWCSAQERERLIQLLQSREGPDAAQARDQSYVRRIIETVRQKGYALSERIAGAPYSGTARCDAIAAPILKGGAAIASLNIVYLSKATSTDEVVAKHLKDLQATARRISELIEDERTPIAVPIHASAERPIRRRRVARGRPAV